MSGRAFTLIETLLALALVAMLSGSIFGFLQTLSERRREMDRVAHREEGASVLCEQLEAGLLCALVGDKTIGPGIHGDGTSIRLISRGVRLGGSRAGSGGPTDLVESEFALDASAGIVKARRWEAGATEPDTEVLVEHVKSLKFRYRVGEEWADDFDSVAKNGLPRAVEVSIWFGEAQPVDTDHKAAPPPAPTPTGDAAAPQPPDRVCLIPLADASTQPAQPKGATQ